MNLEQINELTVELAIYQLLRRLLDFSLVPLGEMPFTISEEGESFYDKLSVHEVLVKPTLEELNNELAVLKKELTDIENSRLAEAARVEDIKARWNGISDIRGALFKANLNETSNPDVELKRIISENDQVRLTLLEVKSTEWQAQLISEAEKKSRQDIGAGVIKCCDKVLKSIIGFNIQTNASKAKKNQMAATFASTLQALRIDLRPGIAMTNILAFEPDGVMVTQEMKDELLAIFAEFGIEPS